MKTIVVNLRDDTRIPFLRGILTRSLLDAGLSFDQAFKLASKVRKELDNVAEISSDDLYTMVQSKLDNHADQEVRENYRLPLASPTRIIVNSLGGNASTFSRGRHERYLLSSGIKDKVAEETTAKVFDQLLFHGAETISTCQLGYLTYLCLAQDVGKKAARRYLRWSEFQRRDKPLLLLIGGAVGTGKSSVTTEIAHRLEIVRTQSTDMLREVMRVMVPASLLPVLHKSSFEAWQAMPNRGPHNEDHEKLVAEGFLAQAQLVSVPSRSVLQRAERERSSMILEGVHALPELLEDVIEDPETITVHVTLAVLKSSELKSRLRGRSSEEPRRKAKRYLKGFESIWSLQSFLLSEADVHDAPIITNDDRNKAIHQIIVVINDELSKHFSGTPEMVFGDVVTQLEDRPERESWVELVPELING